MLYLCLDLLPENRLGTYSRPEWKHAVNDTGYIYCAVKLYN